MPVNFDPDSRADAITCGVTALIRRGGMAAVTMRAIAAETGVSQASLAAHLGGRQRLLQVVAHRFGALRVQQAEQRSYGEGLRALLPADLPELDDLRVWLSWCDLGRTNEGVGNAVADVEAREYWLVVKLLADERLSHSGRTFSPGAPGVQLLAQLDAPDGQAVVAAAHDVLTIVHGIRHLLCATPSAMTTDDARRTADRLMTLAGAV